MQRQVQGVEGHIREKEIPAIFLALDDIVFEGLHLGQVPVLNFEYWDLADHEKFPHLATK